MLGIDDTYVIPGGYIYDFNGMGLITDADGDWLVDWVRGYEDGSTKADEKDWVLGAVDHSTAAVATPPAPGPWYYGTAFPYNDPNSDNDRAGYDAFILSKNDRSTVVYVGARDGMLHAFDGGEFRWGDNPCSGVVENRGYFKWKDSTNTSDCTQNDNSSDASTYCSSDCEPADYGTGEELWAFIPANLLPRLKNNYLQEDDQAYVDASPALADVYVNDAWRTVLLSAEGNGGDTIFCLDVTNPASPQFMWEFADPELFRSRSSPSVAQIGRIYYAGTTKWVAFFVSGKTYDDTLYPSIYVIDIADGSVVEKIALDADPAGIGGILSGQPTIVDSDGNGYVDRLYIGSDKGRLYKVNLPDDPDTVKYGINHCVINTDFTDRDVNEVPGDWHYQPIYGSPAVVSSNGVGVSGQMTYDIRIFFGTGDSPYYDEDVNFGDTRYFFYAYRDTAGKGVCDASKVMLDWFYQLPEGHRIYASAFAAAGNIYFGTSTGETEDPCDTTSNEGVNFDPNAGSLIAFSLDNAEDGPLFQRVVGNVLAAPVVEDKHIYVQSAGGDVESFGTGAYNSATRQGGIPKIDINWWREMF
jgi:Tfp pilus tip-associated adhesin PilY1